MHCGVSMSGVARRLVLHIGVQKTGTSAIQKWFHDNRRALLKRGYYYPETGQWTDHSHHHWAMVLWDAIRSGDRQPMFGLVDALKTECRTVEMNGWNSLILSSEIFEKLTVHPKGRVLLEDMFAALGAEVEIVVFLRRQDLLIESWFKQWVRDVTRRLAMTPEAFIAAHAKFLDYAELLTQWRKLRGVSDIKVATNALVRNPLEEMWRLLSLHGIEKVKSNSELVNASLDGEALRLKYFTNQIALDADDDARVLQEIDGLTLGNERLSLFQPGERCAFLQRFACSNDAIVSTYGVDAFEPPPEVEANRLFKATLDDEALRNLYRLGRQLPLLAERIEKLVAAARA